jgi:NCAIR mutase (PurE)-related protein
MSDFVLDVPRAERIGFGEAVFCAGKSAAQIDAILDDAAGRRLPMLLTRLDDDKYRALRHASALDYDALSRTAYAGDATPAADYGIAIVTAGTSDVPVAREAVRTLAFYGFGAAQIDDVGVAGLWRLMRRIEELRAYKIVIVVAGMDAALPTVLGGLIPGCIIAVPTSVGYGVATGGRAALDAMLASCAPGVVVVNIDNGYGAACGAMRVARLFFFEKKNQKTFTSLG